MELDLSSATIVTSTHYKTGKRDEAVRAELAIESAIKCRELGIKIIAVDGGSDKSLLERLKNEAVSLSPQYGSTLGSARREAMKRAIAEGYKVLIYTELEKVSLIPELPRLFAKIVNNECDIVIPKRRELSSYPLVQQHAEAIGNEFWRMLTGSDLDLFFGPRIFSHKVANYFLNYRGEYGDIWDGIMLPIVRAFADGVRIGSMKVDYTHSERQREVEESDLNYLRKRLSQLNLITTAIDEEWTRIAETRAALAGNA